MTWPSYLNPAIIGTVISIITIVVNYYVIPYQRGTGELLADGSVNWQTGEALFGLSSAILFVPLGLWAARMIWRSYNPHAKVNQAAARF